MGLSRKQIRRGVLRGEYVRLWRGCLSPATASYAARVSSCLQVVGPPAVASLETAARLHGLPTAGPVPDVVLTVPHSRRLQAVPGRVVVRAHVAAGDLTCVRGVPMTSLVRTVEDLCRHRPGREAIITADAAAQRLPSLVECLLARAERRRSGACALRLVAERIRPESGSPLESRWRWEMAEAGLPEPELQYVVLADGVFLARVDFCWPWAKVILEVDGFGPHSDRAAFDRDRRRQNALVLAGWTVLRVTAADLNRLPEVLGLLWAVLGAAV